MSDERTAKELFLELLDLPPEERMARLDAACGEDQTQREQVEQLLAAHDDPRSFLEPWTAELQPLPKQLHAGTIVGRYHILELVGEGGFGEVYRAEQREPIRREVALKVIKLGMDTRQVIARFEAERQALALMDHRNVARVLDAGATADGRPYFVMEYVRGERLTDYCDRHRLSTQARLELFLQTCDAVQHAHQKGIIHRDLKPSNVLVSVSDSNPEAKVIDFGVAKAIDHRLTERSVFTERGQLIGTPEYMSPEQAEMGALDIDTRTDIYSLGVILYELLAGALPFDPTALRQAGFLEIQRIIRDQEPPRPSTRLSDLGEAGPVVAQNHGSEPGELLRQLRGELDWVTMKALEKDRTRRYETPSALALDIRHHLRHEPVSAGPPSTTYIMRKFIRRHRAGVGAAAAVAVLLVAGMAGTSWGLVTANVARDDARAEAVKYETIARFTTGMLSAIEPEIAGDLDTTLMRMILDDAAERVDEELTEQPETETAIRETIGLAYFGIGDYESAQPHLERSRTLLVEDLGNEDPAAIRATNLLAELYAARGLYEQAEPLHRQVHEAAERVHGPDDEATFRYDASRASLLLQMGRYDESESLLLATLERQRKVLRPEHPLILDSMFALANVYRLQSRFDEAASLHQEVLRLREQELGERHPRTLASMNDLATVHTDQRRFDDSRRLLLRVLQIRKSVLGPEHPTTLDSMHNLASLYQQEGRLDEAEPLYVELLELRERVQRKNHPDTLKLLYNLASIYTAQRRFETAEPMHGRVLDARRESLGEEHPYTLDSMHNLAFLYQEMGRDAEASQLYLREIEIRKRIAGESDPKMFWALSNLANTYVSLERFDDAEPLILQVLEARREQFGDHHLETLMSLYNLGWLYRTMERHEEAEPVCVEVLELCGEIMGEDHPRTRMAMEDLIHVYVHRQRYEQAETLMLDYHERLRVDPSADEQSRVEAREQLIRLYEAWDKPDEAARWRDTGS